jgi:hypothetical protein
MTAPGPIQVPVASIRFIGVCEILGAIGMILPGYTRIRPGLMAAYVVWGRWWSART